MGNQKQKWTADEEAALKAGVAKHGPGKWKIILIDAEFAPKLANRSNVDLKDKWRNMGGNHGLGCRDSSTTPKAKATVSTAAVTKGGSSSFLCSSMEKANDSPPHIPQDDKNIPKYSTMILEALSSLKNPFGSDIGAIAGFIEKKYVVPQNFRRLLSRKLRELVEQGELEKGLQCYKFKDSVLSAKPPTPKQNDVRQRPFQQSSTISCDGITMAHAVEAAARWIAEAENKAFVAAEAYKESDRVSQWADDTIAMQTIYEEFLEQCSESEYFWISSFIR